MGFAGVLAVFVVVAAVVLVVKGWDVRLVLLAAALAPTDPVLASDVQVDGPQTEATQEMTQDTEIDESDEVRFALTSEAGLNDGLAFPFVYAAILWASEGSPSHWGWKWLGWELVGKVALGLRVVRTDGSKPSGGSVAVRTLLRLIDGLPFLYLVGVVCILATGQRRQRVGDLAADTTVVKG